MPIGCRVTTTPPTIRREQAPRRSRVRACVRSTIVALPLPRQEARNRPEISQGNNEKNFPDYLDSNLEKRGEKRKKVAV